MKHILITGASSGIGESLALHYAAPHVMLSLCARNEDRLSDVTHRCKEKGAIVHSKIIDVMNKQAMNQWVTERDDHQPIDLVIANAGVSGVDRSLESAAQIFDINMGGVINTIHPIIPKMQDRGEGQIALLSSLAGYRGLPSAPAYSASKVFVKAYGEALRGKHAKDNVKINVICPGFVRSRITDQNDFPMPGFMEGKDAACIIAKGLERDKPVIAFPWLMVLGVWLLSILPARLFQWISQKLPSKSA